jgi:hypothetical protein
MPLIKVTGDQVRGVWCQGDHPIDHHRLSVDGMSRSRNLASESPVVAAAGRRERRTRDWRVLPPKVAWHVLWPGGMRSQLSAIVYVPLGRQFGFMPNRARTGLTRRATNSHKPSVTTKDPRTITASWTGNPTGHCTAKKARTTIGGW